MNDCKLCPALCEGRVNIVPPTPAPARGILAIGEAPGEKEAILAEGFVGAAGKRLDQVMATMGFGRSDYGRANICRCRPPGNRRPTTAEANNCIPLLRDFIADTRPRILILVGATATAPFLGKDSLMQSIEAAEARNYRFDPGLAHPDLKSLSNLDLCVVPIPHTSGLSWNRPAPNGERWSSIGMDQIRKALARLQKSEI